jgi:AAA domain-containing protein
LNYPKGGKPLLIGFKKGPSCVAKFSWKDCVSNFTLQKTRDVAAERGVNELTIEGLRTRAWIGALFVKSWGEQSLCFPIADQAGNVFRAHCRSPQLNGAKKNSWCFEPADPQNRPIPAFVLGDALHAKKIYLFESQWDAISLIDKLDLLLEIDAGDVCLICTRGAKGYGRLSAFNWPADPTGAISIYAFPQNDGPGRDWLDKVIEITGGAYIVETPPAHNDLGEWARDGGATPYDIEGAINNAQLSKPAAAAASNGAQAAPAQFDQGFSIAWYAGHPINPDNTLLGERYLCRGGGMFVVAPSGLGKSTLSIQLAILWCCGLVAFGVKPSKALRILVVQSEDDQGDCTEMAQMMNHLGLSDSQKKRVWLNSELIRCNNLVGWKFMEALQVRLQRARDDAKPFDLVVINPYSVYLGADPKDTVACAQFLNEWLNPILSEFEIAAVLIHHTPKTNFQNTDRYKIWDWMYHGAGAAGITNWARAILVIKPETEDLQVFRFIAAKRGKRIGGDWNGDFERYFAWSSTPGVLVWEDATAVQIAKATARPGAHKVANLDKAFDQVPAVDPELRPKVIEKIQAACGVGRDLAKDALNELIVAGKVASVSFPNPGKGRGFSGVVRI